MKNIVLAGMLAVASFGAVEAKEQVSRQVYCSVLPAVFEKALYAKTVNKPPQEALEMASETVVDFEGDHVVSEVIPLKTLKGIINQVYFDRAFKQIAYTDALGYEIEQICRNGPAKPFKPLK